MAWAEKCFRKSLTQRWCWVPPDKSLMTLDNLHGQTTDTLKAYIKNECNSLVWSYPAGCKEARQPIDAGLGAFLKV